MTETTTLFNLPYIMPSQAQKHVTHNEALRMLDALLHICVGQVGLDAPPVDPTEGERWVVGDAPLDDFISHEGEIAAFQDGTWSFHQPREGWLVWDAAHSALLVFDGAAWAPAFNSQNQPLVGINAIADETNRLAVSAEATLLSHAGAGHQLKLNKASANDTGTLLFQTDWAGRAEMGLAGDDDFSIKVSADGETWQTALSAAGDTGAVSVTKLGIGVSEPISEMHLFSTRASGSTPHMLVRAGKNASAAASVAYQRANSSQQMLFAFETGHSGNPDGYVGTFPNKTETIYLTAGMGGATAGTIGIDKNLGLQVGMAADITSGNVGASITPAGQTYLAGPVGIGEAEPHTSAQLEIASTTKGFLPPRMTTAQRDAIVSLAEGLIIYNLTQHEPQFWNGTVWTSMG